MRVVPCDVNGDFVVTAMTPLAVFTRTFELRYSRDENLLRATWTR